MRRGVTRLFRIVPLRVAAGRSLTAEDYTGNLGPSETTVSRLQPRAVVISSARWKRRFGAGTDVIGAPARFRTYGSVEIVGVLDEAFAFPMFGGMDCWFPDDRRIDQRSSRYLMAIGRLAPGAGFSDAQSEFDVIAARLADAYPESNAGRGVSVTPLRQTYYRADPGTALVFVSGGALRFDDGLRERVESGDRGGREQTS